jgi:hypothetical protein
MASDRLRRVLLYLALLVLCAGQWPAVAGSRSPYLIGNEPYRYWGDAEGTRLHLDAIGWVDLADYFAGTADLPAARLNRTGRPVLAYLGSLLTPFVGAVAGLLFVNLVLWWLTAVYAFKWAELWLGEFTAAASTSVLVATSTGMRVLGGTPVPDALSMFGTVLYLYALERTGLLGATHLRQDAVPARGPAQLGVAIALGVLLGWVLLGKEAYYLVGFSALWGAWRVKTWPVRAVLLGTAVACVVAWFVVVARVLDLPAEPVATGEGGIYERFVMWRDFIVLESGVPLLKKLQESSVTYPLNFGWAFYWVPVGAALFGVFSGTRRMAAYAALYVGCLVAMLFVWRFEAPPVRLLFLAFPIVYAYAALAISYAVDQMFPMQPWRQRQSPRLRVFVLLLWTAGFACAGFLDVYEKVYYG